MRTVGTMSGNRLPRIRILVCGIVYGIKSLYMKKEPTPERSTMKSPIQSLDHQANRPPPLS